jgi:hypothetical protein
LSPSPALSDLTAEDFRLNKRSMLWYTSTSMGWRSKLVVRTRKMLGKNNVR